MKTKLLILGFIMASLFAFAEENIQKIATWNMKWLGTNSGNQLDPVENAVFYAGYILESKATLFALQEIGATHSLNGQPKCFYLDIIIEELNKNLDDELEAWRYILDDTNGNQRLAFLYRTDLWELNNLRSVYPGKSFRYIRRPLVAEVKAVGENAGLSFDFINVHLKAFPDKSSKEKRRANFSDLSNWINDSSLDEDVMIAGDTNIYIEDLNVYQSLIELDFVDLTDEDNTAIHDNQIGQRFDRFYCSNVLYSKVITARNIIGEDDLIDVIAENNEEDIIWFDENISDHFIVILNIDVSND